MAVKACWKDKKTKAKKCRRFPSKAEARDFISRNREFIVGGVAIAVLPMSLPVGLAVAGVAGPEIAFRKLKREGVVKSRKDFYSSLAKGIVKSRKTIL